MKEPMAFPHCFEDCSGARNWIQSPGMTLRDYFAAQAMVGYIASGHVNPDPVAEWAYQHADALLKAREVKSCV